MPRTNSISRRSDRDYTTDFMRAEWVARRLNISKKRVYQLIRAKRLAAVKFGPRQIRVLRESVDEFIQQMVMETESGIE